MYDFLNFVIGGVQFLAVDSRSSGDKFESLALQQLDHVAGNAHDAPVQVRWSVTETLTHRLTTLLVFFCILRCRVIALCGDVLTVSRVDARRRIVRRAC